MRRAVQPRAITADIAVAEIVAQDQDDVRRTLFGV
jgi:hypothetical protein